MAGVGSRDANQETGGRDDAVVGAEHGRAQPADTVGTVTFNVAVRRSHGISGFPGRTQVQFQHSRKYILCRRSVRQDTLESPPGASLRRNCEDGFLIAVYVRQRTDGGKRPP